MKEFFLTTKRLGFSTWSQDDFAKATELWGSSSVTKFITANGQMSADDIQKRLLTEISNYKQYGISYWPIYIKENNELAGCCGLRPYNADEEILELGIHLKEAYWGKGLAMEACFGVIRHAFDTLQVNALFAGHNPNNDACAKLLKKLGFCYTHDEFYPPTGLNHPSYLLTRECFVPHVAP